MNVQDQIDAALAGAGSKISATGAGAAVGGWAMDSNILAFCGFLVAVLGFAMNFYYQHRRDRREEREHEARMKEKGYEI